MEENKVPALILGVGPEARIALDILQSMDVLVYGFISQEDEMVLKELNDVLVVAKMDSQDGQSLLGEENIKYILAEANIADRKYLVDSLSAFKGEIATAIHRSHTISPYVKIGRGNLVNAGVIINANTMVGSFNYLESNVTIEADVAIGDYCNLHAGAIIGSNAQIHDAATIGMGAIIYPGINIGAGALIGTGAVVMQDVEGGKSVFGNPARTLD